MSETTTAPASAEGSEAADGGFDPVIADFVASEASDAAEPSDDAASQADTTSDDLPPDNRDARGIWAELKRTRTRAQEAEARIQRAEQDAQRSRDAALRVIEAQRPQQQQPAQPEIPDVDADPVGHFKAKHAQLERQMQTLAQPIEAQRQEAAFVAATKAAVAQFAATKPDYDDAYAHAARGMDQLGDLLGVPRGNVERFFTAQALRAGKNPGEVAYGLAKSFGYAGPKAAAAPAAAVMDTLERGAQASRSVSGGGGRAPAQVTIETIAQMSPRDFAELQRRNPEMVERAFRGG